MPKSLSQVVSERVRTLREERGWSQEVLAEAAGLSRDALSRIERCDRAARLETVAALAQGLGVELVELLVEDADQPRKPPSKTTLLEAGALRALRAMPPAIAQEAVRLLRSLADLSGRDR